MKSIQNCRLQTDIPCASAWICSLAKQLIQMRENMCLGDFMTGSLLGIYAIIQIWKSNSLRVYISPFLLFIANDSRTLAHVSHLFIMA